jgi:thiamine-phosphate pyrophosphorylase
MLLPPLYPIIDTQVSPHSLDFLIRELATAGTSWIQLREKKANSRHFFSEAQQFVDLARRHGMTAIINDRADVALLSSADGVHLGQEDLPVEHARKILGHEKIIGYSTHNLKQAKEAQESSADYVAIGPVFATTTKENPDPIVNWAELREIRKLVTKPLVAIGGINPENAARLFDLGIDSVAVVRDLLCAQDIRAKVAEFLRLSEPRL